MSSFQCICGSAKLRFLVLGVLVAAPVLTLQGCGSIGATELTTFKSWKGENFHCHGSSSNSNISNTNTTLLKILGSRNCGDISQEEECKSMQYVTTLASSPTRMRVLKLCKWSGAACGTSKGTSDVSVLDRWSSASKFDCREDKPTNGTKLDVLGLDGTECNTIKDETQCKKTMYITKLKSSKNDVRLLVLCGWLTDDKKCDKTWW
eukprot:TRINITY_DN43314_c0_g1_i1.p1 TRINITY_DN43314_c0_g1~~TRINITY_DN43314_c0_g1_i1.p1  ORF type:complete len:206 (+),score=29.06 TRINITY_DN43314_c0_g1_i1:33-650(+)